MFIVLSVYLFREGVAREEERRERAELYLSLPDTLWK